MSAEVRVARLPLCDLCKVEGLTEAAHYDGQTLMGPWAYMCAAHFESHGVGLGLGRGQFLVLEVTRNE